MAAKRERQSFVVVFTDVDTAMITKVVGPYRSFKRAEGIAKAYNRANKQETTVEVLTKPERF